MRELRKYIRTKMACSVEVNHPGLGTFTVKTRDISDGGVFLLTANKFSVGDVLVGQVIGMAEEAPKVKMKIVRVEAEGVGVEFCD